jgi:hypothetical protein
VGGQRHAPAALPPGVTRYPLYRRLGRPQGRSGRVLKISPPPGFDPRTVHPVASRYTDYAIPAPTVVVVQVIAVFWVFTVCTVLCSFETSEQRKHSVRSLYVDSCTCGWPSWRCTVHTKFYENAPHIVNLGARRRRAVSFTPRLLYNRGNSPPYPFGKRLTGPQSRSGHGDEKNIQSGLFCLSAHSGVMTWTALYLFINVLSLSVLSIRFRFVTARASSTVPSVGRSSCNVFLPVYKCTR